MKGGMHIIEIAWSEQNEKELAKLHPVYVLVSVRLTKPTAQLGVLPRRFEVKVEAGSHIRLSDCPENGTSTL